MRRLALFGAAAIAVAGWVWTGNSFAEDQLDRVGDAAEKTGEGVGDAVEDTGEATGDAAQDATERAANEADRTSDRAEDAAKDAAVEADADAKLDAAAEDAAIQAADEDDVDEDKNMGTAALELPPGVKPKETDDAEDIRDMLASASEAAIKGKPSDVVERLVDADRNRIGSMSEEQVKSLTDKMEQIQTAWKEKYGNDFDIEDEEAVFGEHLTIVQGEIEDPAMLMGHWPVANGPAGDGAVMKETVMREGADAVKTDGEAAEDVEDDEDRNIEKGRDVAVAQLAAEGAMPAVTLSLIQEKPDNWRIDVPDAITGQTLHDNLMEHLSAIQADSANWPTDQNAAYRAVCHHILMAVLDIDTPAMAPAGAADDAGGM